MSALVSLALAPIFGWQSFWRRRAKRPCPICDTKLQGQVGSLLGAGFYPAAVAAARLRLELVTVAYYQRMKGLTAIPRDGRAKREKPSFSVIVMFLARIGEISHEQRNRLLDVYSRTSLVIHGEPCPRHLAKRLIADAAAAIEGLREDQERPVPANLPERGEAREFVGEAVAV